MNEECNWVNVVTNCLKLEEFYTDDNGLKVFDGIQLAAELKVIIRRVNDDITPLELLKYLEKLDLHACFPNLSTVLKLFITLPVSVASGERSFSKLKLTKTYLRNTMTQKRLNNLLIISIEKDISLGLDLFEVVDEFSKLKARKVIFDIQSKKQ